MKKFVIGIITVSLLVTALTGLYIAWNQHQRAKEAEAALANSEANKPQRYKGEAHVSNWHVCAGDRRCCKAAMLKG
jgi:hypothetical protein